MSANVSPTQVSAFTTVKFKAWQRHLHWLPFLTAAVVLFILLLIVPLGVMVRISLQENPLAPDQGGGLANYLYFFGRNFNVQAVYRTLRISIVATGFSLFIGYVAALALRRVIRYLGNTPLLILSFYVLSGPIVVVLGWMILLTGQGIVTQWIGHLQLWLGLTQELPQRLLGTETAVIIGLVHFTLAFVILNLMSVLSAIDPQLEEAARNLGASRWQVFTTLLWPLSRPGVLSASLIAFALCMNAYVNPAFLGSPNRPVMTILIRNYLLTTSNWPMAAASSVILIGLSIAVIAGYKQLTAKWR